MLPFFSFPEPQKFSLDTAVKMLASNFDLTVMEKDTCHFYQKAVETSSKSLAWLVPDFL